MIRSLTFEPSLARVRPARFTRRPNMPLDAACFVANGVREALRVLIGETTLTIGEPVAIEPAAWQSLIRDAFTFVTPGRVTDVIFVIGRRDARALVQAGFGESGTTHDGAWTALECGALERMMGRCAAAADALCGERRGQTRALSAHETPPCVTFFDVRVAAPVQITLGIGVVREPPTPSAAASFLPAVIASVAVEVRVILGRGSLSASSFLELRVGNTVRLTTKVDGEGELNVAGQEIATGTCGVRHGHAAFAVRSTSMRGVTS